MNARTASLWSGLSTHSTWRAHSRSRTWASPSSRPSFRLALMRPMAGLGPQASARAILPTWGASCSALNTSLSSPMPAACAADSMGERR
ncbi:hypothetical protein D3C85_1520720 [compost metagenome]